MPPVTVNSELTQTKQTIIDGGWRRPDSPKAAEWSHNFHFLRGASRECTGIRFHFPSADLPPEEALAVVMKRRVSGPQFVNICPTVRIWTVVVEVEVTNRDKASCFRDIVNGSYGQ